MTDQPQRLMTVFRWAGRAALSAGVLILLAGQAQGEAPDDGNELGEFDAYVLDQAERQAAGMDSPFRRVLDFTPFEPALNAFTPEHAAQVDSLINGATIPDLQAHMQSGALTSEQLVTYYLHRIRQEDSGRLNSIIELNPDALNIARGLDAERANGTVRGVLHGIPVTLKDNIGTGDTLHTSAGAAVLADYRAPRDSFLVANLRQAGAVILGKNNLSEWANFYSTRSVNGYSALGGHTRNPHGKFDAGGSSSGSAVAVSANLVTVAVGSETTGSLVYPASQNGVVTIKPGIGLVSRDGVIPITAAFDTAGPLARNVTDAAVLLNALSIGGVDINDDATQDAAPLFGVDFTASLNPDALRGVRVGLITRQTEDDLRAGDLAIHDQVRERLMRAGAVIVPVESLDPYIEGFTPEDLSASAFRVLQLGFRMDLELYLSGNNAPVKTLAEIIAFNYEDPKNRIPYGQDLIEQSAEFLPQHIAQYPALARDVKAAYARAIDSALVAHDVVALIDFSNYASPYHSRAGYPAITVPAGTRASGEPLGVTFFGAYLSEPLLIGLAYAFESQAGK